MRMLIFAVLAAMGVLLTACGGGGSGSSSSSAMSVQMPNPSPGQSIYNTEEFRANYALEAMGALYAYEQGYHGQGVTVHITEDGVRATHTDLSPNIITLSPAVGGVDNDFDDSDSSVRHGTNVAGLLAATRNGVGMHGVAPSVKIVFPFAGRKYAADQKIPIINDSAGVGNKGLFPYTDLADITTSSDLMRLIAESVNEIEGADVVWVSAMGNDGRNSIQSTINQPDLEAYIPFIRPGYENNLLVVGALNTATVVASYDGEQGSNGCGVAMRWCIFSFGISHDTTDSGSDTDYRTGLTGFPGTSAAAPHVAGALAVLKSAAPMMPITVIRAILLTTATDIGEAGIDELYGWGLVNISTGIRHIENLKTTKARGVPAVKLRDLRGRLPAEFSHLHRQMAEVLVAVQITDNSYHNVPLADIVSGGGLLPAKIGDAAKGLLTNDFAAGDAFRFWGGLDYTDGDSRFIAENGGAFGAADTSDTGGYIRWTTAGYGGLSAFGEYERTAIAADFGGNSLITGIQGATADGWTAGLQFADIMRFGDRLQLSARQEARISGGDMILRYPVADGDFYDAFIGDGEQTIWTAGYTVESDGGKWSAAAEWNAQTGEKGFSAAIVVTL